MGKTTSPTDQEIDRMMELYEEFESKKAVAEHDDVDWSRPTVSKWIDRRLEAREEEEKEAQQVQEHPMSASPGDTAPPEPEGDYTDNTRDSEKVTPQNSYDSNPVDVEEPPSPNEVLLSVVDRDPKLGEDEAEYLQQFFPDYGQLSPSDVATILNDLNFNNKRKTIDRVISRYRDICNRKLREDPDLQYDKRWAVLLTKETGDQRYIQQAQEYQPRGGGIGGINAPPSGQGGAQQMTGGGAGITAPASPPTGGQQQSQIQSPPTQQQNGGPQQFMTQQPQQQQQENGVNEFQQRILDMLEEQLDNEPEPTPTAEPSDPSSQIQQLVELQGQIQQLREMGDSGDDQVAQQIEGVVDQFDQRMARLEQQVTEAASEQTQQQPMPQPESVGDSMLAEVAALAETGVSQDLLEMFMEMNMDPEVMEARAKTREVESESEWKKAIAESLSPAAAEKAIDAFSTVASSVSRGAQAAQQSQPRRQPQPQQQAQPQQRPQGQPQQRAPARETQGVEVVEDDPEPAPEGEPPEPRTSDTGSDGEASPLREEGEQMAAEVEQEDDGSETDTEGEDE